MNHFFKIRGPFLVVVPLSTAPHWQREIEQWTNMNAVIFHGNADARDVILKYEWETFNGQVSPFHLVCLLAHCSTWFAVQIHKGIYRFNVVITTYEMVLAEVDTLSKIRWRVLVSALTHVNAGASAQYVRVG